MTLFRVEEMVSLAGLRVWALRPACPSLAARVPHLPTVHFKSHLFCPPFLGVIQASPPPALFFYFLTPSFHFLAPFLENAWWEIATLPKMPESELRGLERQQTGTSGQGGRAPGDQQP